MEDYQYHPIKDLTELPSSLVLIQCQPCGPLITGLAVGYAYQKPELSRPEYRTTWTLPDGTDVTDQIVGKTLKPDEFKGWKDKGATMTSAPTGKKVITQQKETLLYGETVYHGLMLDGEKVVTVQGYYDIPDCELNAMADLPDNRPVLVKRKAPSHPQPLWAMAYPQPSHIPGNPGSLCFRQGSIFLGNEGQVSRYEGWLELPTQALLAYIDKMSEKVTKWDRAKGDEIVDTIWKPARL